MENDKMPAEYYLRQQVLYRDGEEPNRYKTMEWNEDKKVKEPILFFSKITHSIGAKNNLQLAIITFVKTLEREFLTKSKAEKLVINCDEKVNELNKKYNRCKPESVRVYAGSDGDINLYFGDYIYLHLYREKEVKNED